ncbi:lytic transglycosylase domain-containing protein [Novosphingobium terrae]|uniref:lytic transglycosylase domain-containing protein n=1 Tax=Novosphingobium terrae TaxID=2726189 RepID=UPI001F1443C9|nr:lytic transglycosylase domain-containing protein [Novosphingobium terrae]
MTKLGLALAAISGLISSTVGSAAYADTANVITFQSVPRAKRFVLTAPAVSRDPGAVAAVSGGQQNSSLEADFTAQGEGAFPLGSPIAANSSIVVPTWMRLAADRSGFAPSPDHVFAGSITKRTNGPCDYPVYRPNHHISLEAESRRATFYRAMAQAACDAGIPVVLFDALITQESRYNPAALSPKGAVGMSQLMPARARALGVTNAWSIEENLAGGARHMRALLDEFGRFDLALAAYNAGEGRVRGKWQVPRIRETVDYVSTILKTIRDLQLGANG